MDGLIIKQLERFDDERGWLTEVFRNDELEYAPAMAYVSLTNPGVVRGPHEHVNQSDCFVFVGPGNFELHLWDRRENSATKDDHLKITVGQTAPTMVIVPPGIVHGYKCVSDTPAYSINLPNVLYKGKGKAEEVDEIRWEHDPASPYKIV